MANKSFSNTKQYLERLEVERSRTAIHNWVQSANLRPTSGAAPDHIAVDETVIQVNDERRWLYAAVIPRRTNSCTIGSLRRGKRSVRCRSCGDFDGLYRSPRGDFG
jgi:transposase-like protein